MGAIGAATMAGCGPKGPAEAPAVAGSGAATAAARAPDACGRVAHDAAATLDLGGGRWTLAGGVLRAEGRDDDAVARLGVVADVDAGSAGAPEALADIVSLLRARGIDAVVVPGGLGGEPAALSRALGALGGAGVPVFVGLGARGSHAALAAALAANAGTALGLADLDAVEGDDFTLVPVAGHPVARAVPADGCRAGAAELARAAAAVRGAAGPRVLVSHAPPRIGGAAGIDRTGTAAIGWPALGALLDESGVHFGLFGDVTETAGTASDRKGQAVAPGVWAVELMLNGGAVDVLAAPGAAGTVPGVAVASVLEIDSSKAVPVARYERIVSRAGSAGAWPAP